MVGRVAAKPTLASNEAQINLRFGGGLNTRASTDEIDSRECADGSENFDLDLANSQFRPRKQFDLAWTAPNAGQINGFFQLITTNGSIFTGIQAGTVVYATDFYTTSVLGSVSAAARLRGPKEHIWNLTDTVLISDLGAVEPVMSYDGTYLNVVDHSMSGTFIAKYIYVDNERAFYGNVISNGNAYPHVVIASAISDYVTVSSSNRPSFALGAGDAWFLPMPDLKPINGMVGAYGLLTFSTLRGHIYKLTGSSAQDYFIDMLYADLFADGNESIAFIGNDIAVGRPGRIESLMGVNNYGDVETNNIALKIGPSIEEFKNWTLAYSSRHQRLYCYPATEAEMWVYHKPLQDSGLSPWMKWTTMHTMGFQPTCMWSMLDPQTGFEHVFMGDDSGNVYRLEGTDTGGDGGTTDISATRISKLMSMPVHAQAYDIQGALKYRPIVGQTSTCDLTFRWQGESAYDTTASVPMDESIAGSVFGGSAYFGGSYYFGNSFQNRLLRERFAVEGQGNELQVEASVASDQRFQINEVFIGHRAAG